MGVTDEKPQVSAASLIEKIQTAEIEKYPVSFNWPRVKEGCRRLEHITLGDKPDESYALLLYQEPLPDQFPTKLEERLETYTDARGKSYRYIQRGNPPKHVSLEKACDYLTELGEYPPSQKSKTNERAEPTSEGLPLQVSTEQLLEEIKDKVCLIYTGAGVSIEKSLPDSAQLKRQLGIDMNKDVDGFVSYMSNSDGGTKIANTLQALQQMFYGEPTRSHNLLAEVQTLTSGRVALATENLDKLHEKTGYSVIPLGRIEQIPQEYLQQVDFIITIGLKQNFTGLIPRYKAENPKGKVVAVNVAPPPYSYSVDEYVVCEAQEFCLKLKDDVEKEV